MSVYRVALTNNRMLSIDDDQVCFRYQDSRKHCWKILTLPALEFIRRFLQHVLTGASTRSATVGFGALSIGLCCIRSRCPWRVKPLPHP